MYLRPLSKHLKIEKGDSLCIGYDNRTNIYEVDENRSIFAWEEYTEKCLVHIGVRAICDDLEKFNDVFLGTGEKHVDPRNSRIKRDVKDVLKLLD